jgi:hypothetical protein
MFLNLPISDVFCKYKNDYFFRYPYHTRIWQVARWYQRYNWIPARLNLVDYTIADGSTVLLFAEGHFRHLRYLHFLVY